MSDRTAGYWGHPLTEAASGQCRIHPRPALMRTDWRCGLIEYFKSLGLTILRTFLRREIKPLDGMAMFYTNKTKVSLQADFEVIQGRKAMLLSRFVSHS